MNTMEKTHKHTTDDCFRIFNSRYTSLASNTIDYWMTPDSKEITVNEIFAGLSNATVTENTTLQIYIHVPFCIQKCLFCAFSGGNHTDYKNKVESLSKLLVWQMQDLLQRTNVKNHAIQSVHIGGGSPNLLGKHIGNILKAVRDLPGCNENTEIAVEMELNSTTEEFIKELVKYEITKASFGLQTLDPQVRKYMNLKDYKNSLDRVLTLIDGRIPIINVDLMNCLPGQTLNIVDSDLRAMIKHPSINSISSYLLTSGAAPALVSKILQESIPPQASMFEQILMRLNTFLTFKSVGWVRKGTETYMDPSRISEKNLAKIAGNECIGSSNYESYLLGIGPQAISYMPGLRLENYVNIDQWMKAAEQGEHPFFLEKCSTIHQKDLALWSFPLFNKGLAYDVFDRLISENVLDESQLTIFNEFINEGFIIETPDGYNLSLLGEVFKGQLVLDLKKQQYKKVVCEYIDEGIKIAKTITEGNMEIKNEINNRQIKLNS